MIYNLPDPSPATLRRPLWARQPKAGHVFIPVGALYGLPNWRTQMDKICGWKRVAIWVACIAGSWLLFLGVICAAMRVAGAL